jgi:hypothetical protein
LRKRIVKDTKYKVSIEFDYILKELEKWSSESIPVLLDRMLKHFLDADQLFIKDKMNEYDNNLFLTTMKQLELSHKINELKT